MNKLTQIRQRAAVAIELNTLNFTHFAVQSGSDSMGMELLYPPNNSNHRCERQYAAIKNPICVWKGITHP